MNFVQARSMPPPETTGVFVLLTSSSHARPSSGASREDQSLPHELFLLLGLGVLGLDCDDFMHVVLQGTISRIDSIFFSVN